MERLHNLSSPEFCSSRLRKYFHKSGWLQTSDFLTLQDAGILKHQSSSAEGKHHTSECRCVQRMLSRQNVPELMEQMWAEGEGPATSEIQGKLRRSSSSSLVVFSILTGGGGWEGLTFLLWKPDLSTASVLKIASYHLEFGTRGEIISMMRIHDEWKEYTWTHIANRNYPREEEKSWGQWRDYTWKWVGTSGCILFGSSIINLESFLRSVFVSA